MLPWGLVCLAVLSCLPLGDSQATRGCPPQDAILPCRCLTRGREIQVWCSHSNLPKVLEGLRSVGQYLHDPIDELILENNHLPALPGKTFVPLKVLRLMLRYNGVERVSVGWLVGLESSLMELFIVEPDLRSLPEDSLDRLAALEAVTIQSNLMKRLPRFSGLPKLRYLQIESLSLVEMSSRHFRVLPALEKLHVTGSPRLTRLEGGLLQDLPSLTLVNISFCGISWIHPRAITHLPVLKELWLVGNKVADAVIVGRSIRDLPALEILRLDYNHIDKLGEAAFVDLPSLKRLYMSNNKITDLHHGTFHRVPKLKMLDLNRNLVRRIHPESFLQHSGSGLEELWLMENDLSHVAELRSLLDALPRLIFLDMSHNNLEAIPFGALRGHPTLERLHLDHNKIHLIEREAFMAMPALRELRLKNNSLSDMLDVPLWNLPALKGLDLSENYFRRIDPRLLANLPSLRKVDLSSNDLTAIDPASFSGTPALEHINISRNILTAIHPGTFRHLIGLYELDANYNRLVEFIPGLPHGIEYLHMAKNQINELPSPSSPDLELPSLKMLDLSGNGIQKLPSAALASLTQLKKLYLGSNSLQKLEEGALKSLMRLQILDLHDNRLMQIHPNAVKDATELRELNLGENRLNILRPEVLRNGSRLKKLNISNNQLTEIQPGTLENIRDVQILDASHNSLIFLPQSLNGMKNLRVLDLTDNKLKNFNLETLSSLTSLSELKMSHNFLQELKKGTFDGLPHLKALYLDNNDLQLVDADTFHALPSLRLLKLNKNKLREIPSHTFSNLPLLQVVELQENRLSNIAKNAFYEVPHLLMLNLSHNQLPALEEAGLRSLRSLEMLDLTNNHLARVSGGNLERMEWLVELRMDSNKICSVHGAPFNGMPRLRVLSMRDNKMVGFPEDAVMKLRGNLAVLDLEGNPLACTCNIVWFRAWLQESSLVGPRCNDGILLRDMRLSRQECAHENRPDPVVPGCEAELLSAPGIYDTSQVFSQWMDMKDNVSLHVNKLAPTPEESDYFYDEYVDYPYNETLIASNLLGNVSEVPETQTQKSSHYIAGDTPTIYAAPSRNKSKLNHVHHKDAHASPGNSGFTFFGVPLPSFNLNLNNIWGRGSGRGTEKAVDQTAERKSAIINYTRHPGQHIGHQEQRPVHSEQPQGHPVHPEQQLGHPEQHPSHPDQHPGRPPHPGYLGPGQRLEYPEHPGHLGHLPPTMPEIQTGGFVPILPGSGGFKPILNPLGSVGVAEIERVNISEIRTTEATTTVAQNDNVKSESFGHPVPTPTVPTSTTTTTAQTMVMNTTHLSTKIEIQPYEMKPQLTMLDKNETSETSMEKQDKQEADMNFVTSVPKLEATEKFEDIFKEYVDVSIPPAITTENSKPTADPTPTTTIFKPTALSETIPSTIKTTTSTTTTAISPPRASNALSPLLAPQYRPQGRPIITRVQSPHVSASAPLLSDLEISEDDPLPSIHSRDAKTTFYESSTTQKVDIRNQDMSWYYINYNKTNLEPYIGPGGTFPRSSGAINVFVENITYFVLITLHVVYSTYQS